MAELYIVATPIGNLGDITLRALETLREVEYIYAEDTRVTGVLLHRYEIRQPLKSYREAAEAARVKAIIKEIIGHLEAGKSVAYVSDAGTPGVSDPGNFLVSQVLNAGFRVVPIPGANALTTLISASGLPALRPLFIGFLPKKKGHQTLMRQLAATLEQDICDTIVFYESPYRVVKFLEELLGWGVPLTVAVGRELTKLHEEIVKGTTDEVLDYFKKKSSMKGEFVIAISKA